MRNSLARSLSTCRCHDNEACEKPWMKRISEPDGLPHSCAAMVTPSGVRTTSGLYFFSWARPGAEIASRSSVAPAHGPKQRKNVDIIVWSSLQTDHSPAASHMRRTRQSTDRALRRLREMIKSGNTSLHRTENGC